ncbi:MAG: tetratricopeptide repeat protein [Flavobacteriales bacterium]|jgi:serine phosphatase RsbU (regulator of sigma subunit)|nr:tetratricopeptide repeat protein [Flavobacteriales bacterium]
MPTDQIEQLLSEIRESPENINTILAIAIDLFLQVKQDEIAELILKAVPVFEEIEHTNDLSYYISIFEALDLIHSGNYFLALDKLNGTLVSTAKDENIVAEAVVYCLNGICYRSIGEHAFSLFYHLRSNELIEYNTAFIKVRLINIYQIGELHTEEGDYEAAIEFLMNTIKTAKKTTDTDPIKFRTYSGLTNVFIKKNKLREAEQCLSHQRLFMGKNLVNQSRYYSDKALFLQASSAYQEAISFELKSLNIREKLEKHDAKVSCYISLGKSYFKIKAYDKAIEYAEKGLELSILNNTKNKVLLCHQLMASIYKAIDKKDIAFYHLEEYVTLADRIKQEERRLNNEIKQRILSTQKIMFEESLKELSSSIRYAERIQRAMLQPTENLKSVLPESLIFFKPHSVVSGDFYWFGNVDGKTVIAVGDCTGHGVPAGMLTMKGHGILTGIVSDSKITQPDEILNVLAEKFYQDLDYENSKVEDGMDISICTIDQENQSILFAGARSPLLIIDNHQATKIHGDRISIGGALKQEKFTCHKITISKTANYFMYTDGYTDQFGGEKNKKFKNPNFVRLLLETYGHGANYHLNKIEETFMNWRGLNQRKLTPQTDDVLIIGFSIQ